ncbi:hypothetical protein GOP47_0004868 [Adiantum capillus-veneris]|uniref:RNA polymerase-associated protein LEO1 n=1 Tax=Adiantum capillus-veneris TaxID=13818 RepID=A0A9D4ZL16_ADICA|nr:hypothetical protein GOP47_0004868 [Adiantum capillus-veneris]
MGEKRNEMMETLFGAESEGSEDDEALERPSAPYSDDEVEGGGQIDAESEGERPGSEHDREESEAERVESEAEREESDAEHSYDGEELNQQRRPVIPERRGLRQQVSASGSEQSQEDGQPRREDDDEVDQYHGDQNAAEGVEEVEQVREQSDEADDSKGADGVAGMRDVFGDSDEEEQEADDLRRPSQAPEEMSASDDEASVQKGIRPEDIVPDVEQHEEQFESDDEQPRPREKPVGPPLQIYLPSCPPPGTAEKMHIVRVSNIMGIESKPFDPKTYIEEEEQFITDETGHKQRLRLEDNIARWRKVRDREGNSKYESNARFVKWSDGSMQLLIGNEVLDISIQKANQDQGHLFVRHDKGVLQSQGRLLQKMKFMPSSLSSKSHRLLTALVDSRNRKIYKVKNVITNKDPEREKEEAEKLHQKRIRNKEDLQRKQEKINRKYNPTRERAEQQLSPGFLEGALMEDEEVDEYQRQMEEESRAERRIMNAKRSSATAREAIGKRIKSRHPSPPQRRDVEERYAEESEHSEYESDDEEENPREEEDGDADVAEVDEEEEQGDEAEHSEGEQEKEGGWEDADEEMPKKRKSREDDSENEPSPPRKPVQRRRVVVSESDED